MRFIITLLFLAGACREPMGSPEVRDSSPTLSRVVFPAPLPDCGKVDAGARPDTMSWKAQLRDIIEPAVVDHQRLQLLQALLLDTERLDAPFVTIGPAPRKYDSGITLRVTAKFPGRRMVTVDHVSLSLALQQALRLGLGMTRNPDGL